MLPPHCTEWILWQTFELTLASAEWSWTLGTNRQLSPWWTFCSGQWWPWSHPSLGIFFLVPPLIRANTPSNIESLTRSMWQRLLLHRACSTDACGHHGAVLFSATFNRGLLDEPSSEAVSSCHFYITPLAGSKAVKTVHVPTPNSS